MKRTQRSDRLGVVGHEEPVRQLWLAEELHGGIEATLE